MGLIAKTSATSKLVDLLDKIQKQAVDIAHSQDKKSGKVSMNVTSPKRISKIVLDERAQDIINLLKTEIREEIKTDIHKILDERMVKHIGLRHPE